MNKPGVAKEGLPGNHAADDCAEDFAGAPRRLSLIFLLDLGVLNLGFSAATARWAPAWLSCAALFSRDHLVIGVLLTVVKLSLSGLPNLERWSSCQVQRGLNAAFQDLLCLGSVGYGPRELEGAYQETEDGRRAAAAAARQAKHERQGDVAGAGTMSNDADLDTVLTAVQAARVLIGQ